MRAENLKFVEEREIVTERIKIFYFLPGLVCIFFSSFGNDL